MSTKDSLKNTTTPAPLDLRELGEVLVRHYGLTDGMFDVLIEYQFGIGAFGPSPDQTFPGFAAGVSKIGLAPAAIVGPMTIDASRVPRRPRPSKS